MENIDNTTCILDKGVNVVIFRYIAISLLYASYITVNLFLIIGITAVPKLRQRPGNWFLICMAICFLIPNITFVDFHVQPRIGLPVYSPGPYTCEVIIFFCFLSIYSNPFCVLLVTIDRYVSIVKSSGSEPGFCKKTGIICIAGTLILVIILMVLAFLKLGLGYSHADGHCSLIDTYVAVSHIVVYHTTYLLTVGFLMPFILLMTFILIILTIIYWCKSTSPEVGKAALPVVVANTIYVIVTLLHEIIALSGPPIAAVGYIHSACGIVVPLLWVTLSQEFRKLYMNTRCPCCHTKIENEPEIDSLEPGEHAQAKDTEDLLQDCTADEKLEMVHHTTEEKLLSEV